MRLRSYEGPTSDFPIPSIVVKARKTKVNLGGSRKGLSACVANRSCPSLARLARRDALRSSGVIWFSHLLSAFASVDWNVLSMFLAIRSIEKRSTPGRSTPIFSSASHASLGMFS
eukprot:scaffold303863_cov27-Tisochrysis_lutea.AAC.1